MQQDALTYVGRIEEAMVQGFPFKVPERFAELPQLKVNIFEPTSFTLASGPIVKLPPPPEGWLLG